MAKQYWLMKSEPDVYSYDDLVAEGEGTWDGVRNHTAAINLKAMKTGDEAFFYHSNIGLEVVAIMTISKEHFIDPSDEKGRFVAVKVKPVRKIANPGDAEGHQGKSEACRHATGSPVATVCRARHGRRMERNTENGRRVSANPSNRRLAVLCPVPEYEEDWSQIRADYKRLFGDDTAFVDWTKASNLADFDRVTPLLAWGYQRDVATWFALLDQLESEGLCVSNPVGVLRWNSDKAYLAELDAAGVATVPTRVCHLLDHIALDDARTAFGTDILVIKPPISGGADGTFRLGKHDAPPESVAGRRMMIQPFLPSIATEGEYSLFYFGGQFSHSIIKRPAKGDFRVQDQFGGYEEAVEAPGAAKALALAALQATARITDTGTLAYARVDMLRGGDGHFRLMELELIEPSLFLRFASDNGVAFAKALLAAD